MEKKVPVKTLYLLLVISVGLIGLGIGSTYAVFTASAEISNPISLGSNLSYNGDLIETVSVAVPAGATVTNVLNITNSTSDTLNYTAWYISDGFDIEVGTSAGTPTGSLAGNSSTSVTVDIKNNTSDTVTVILGISSSTSSVTLASGMTIIPNEKLSLEGAALYITNLYLSGNPSAKTQSGSGNTYYYAESVGLMNDGLDGVGNSTDSGNIRYYGANPNNYIYFNCDDYTNQTVDTCEKWRIIGVVDGKVKIMKMESIAGTISWDNSSDGTYSNNWNESSVNDLLNYNYYNNIDKTDYYTRASSGSAVKTSVNFATNGNGIKNDETRNLISKSNWYLGGYNTESIYASDMYRYERGDDVYSGHPLTWNGNVGLIYPSDYAYSSDLSLCGKTLRYYESDTNCLDTNWMFSHDTITYGIWTITPKSNNNTNVTRIYETGYINWNAANLIRQIHPTVYLNSDVNIAEGDGTSESPYKIYVEVPATKYITNLYLNNKDDVVTNNSIEYQYATSVNLMNDRLGGTTEDYDAGNIRYYGADPNNYIDIGDRDSEGNVIPYRIIGVFKDMTVVNDDGTTETQDLIKVVRADPIGDYMWNTYTNDWSQAQLMILLNPGYDTYSSTNPLLNAAGDVIYGFEGSLWWNERSGSCYYGEAGGSDVVDCDFTSTGLSKNVHNKLEKVVWNLGATDMTYSDFDYGYYSDDYYSDERGSLTDYDGRTTEWTGYVALMYVSDYGYGADFNVCSDGLYNYSEGCYSSDWIYITREDQWLLNPCSSDFQVFEIDYLGKGRLMDYDNGFAVSKLIRPSFYLSSELVIESGSGTDIDPYVIR